MDFVWSDSYLILLLKVRCCWMQYVTLLIMLTLGEENSDVSEELLIIFNTIVLNQIIWSGKEEETRREGGWGGGARGEEKKKEKEERENDNAGYRAILEYSTYLIRFMWGNSSSSKTLLGFCHHAALVYSSPKFHLEN